ncbi:hypothetical protein QO010_000691 [Caulobacter ginsengisoli]|uniref:Tyrosine specific protein phosphatases domain-containing protein n=1 Tax=Caulobacter ginsengisoli TaxID=400775 RepID=A0ABU0IP44_9CAUL|nr:hypothetical protein [Caulobacter ginsengisoli]MDQ0462943.1 hypothetical protein [Caulobacter ginsengisoli]
MIEVHPNLHVGGEVDERRIRGQPGWFTIHACKEPYHRQALGYTGPAASKDHPEYLIARRDSRLILNLVDAPNVKFIGPSLIDAALAAIEEHIGTSQVLVHCNQGMSRSPTIAFLYLAKHTDRFRGLGHDEALAAFRTIYPPYNAARGMSDYTRIHWDSYAS